MKSFVCILVLGGLGLGGWLVWDNHMEAKKAATRARLEARQKAEEERKKAEAQAEEERRVQAELLAKEEALRLLNRFITAQEKLIRVENEELKMKLEMVDLDAQSLSTELIAIDKLVERKANAANKVGKKIREKIEHVEAMLESKVVARLANTYLGEDFAAERLKFKSQIQQWIRIEEESAEQLAKNREKYNTGVRELDEEVETKLKIARTRLDASSAAISQRAALYKREYAQTKQRRDELRAKEKELANLERMRNKKNRLATKDTLSPWEIKELSDLEKRLDHEEEKVARQNEINALAQANLAHLEVTAAEVQARRRGDKLTAEKAEEDDAVVKSEMREKDYFLFAEMAEKTTLGNLRNAIYNRKAAIGEKLAVNERKLKVLFTAQPNMDMLTAEQINNMRTRIAEQLKEDAILNLTECK